jgi:hypothetical protein
MICHERLIFNREVINPDFIRLTNAVTQALRETLAMNRTSKFATLALALSLSDAAMVWSGPPYATSRSGFVAGRAVTPGRGADLSAQRRSFHPPIVYYVPYQAPVLVISPYGPSYYLPPTVVATAPFFCVLHNDGFVSRVGLLDHLSGMHKISLDAAATLCSDGMSSCIFPSY